MFNNQLGTNLMFSLYKIDTLRRMDHEIPNGVQLVSVNIRFLAS